MIEVIEISEGTTTVVGGAPVLAQQLDDLTDVTGAAAGTTGQVLARFVDGQWGPAAAGGGSPVNHIQATPAAVWGPIAHNYGYRPTSVALFSADYTQQYGQFIVQHLDANSLRIAMDTPTAGVALIG